MAIVDIGSEGTGLGSRSPVEYHNRRMGNGAGNQLPYHLEEPIPDHPTEGCPGAVMGTGSDAWFGAHVGVYCPHEAHEGGGAYSFEGECIRKRHVNVQDSSCGGRGFRRTMMRRGAITLGEISWMWTIRLALRRLRFAEGLFYRQHDIQSVLYNMEGKYDLVYH